MKKAKNIFKWVLTILLGLEFIIAGQAKFTNAEIWIKQFEGWGYPDSFRILIGALELIAAIFLFIPKFRTKAALLLIVIMLGAFATHAIHAQWPNTIVTIVLVILLGVLYILSSNKPFKLKK
ncbi:DoxX family protein [Winogradskyella sp. 3972H.M.0a.05]|uniref:DoxX family protein n=1 Tax=Winogradskyella sp. 3972H.M.0a.05 TaxID=2950277 RepID=UPI003393C5D5